MAGETKVMARSGLNGAASDWALLNVLPVAVYVCGRDGRVLNYNRCAAELWGREPDLNSPDERFCGSYKIYRIDGTYVPHDECPMAEVLRTGIPVRGFEAMFERPDGGRVTCLVNIEPLFDAEGAIAGAVNCFQDITASRRASEETRQSREHLRAIVETTPECVKIVARDGTLLHMNPAGLQMAEADSASDIEGTSTLDLIAPEDRDLWHANHLRVCDGEKLSWAFDIIGRRGTRRHMETQAVPLRLSDGRIVQLAITRDVTLRKGYEHALLGSEQRLRDLLDALPAAVYTTDAAGHVTYFNEAAAELAGREPALGEDEWCASWRLYWPDGRPMPHDQCPMAVALKENRPVRGEEAILERPDGTRVSFIPYPTPLRDASGTLLGAVNMLVDITEQKAAEETRAYLAAIVESSDDAIISKDLDGNIRSWNRGAEAMFGHRADEVIGRHITLIIPPERLAEEDDILSRLRRGEPIDHFETVRRHKDGHEIDVSLTISPVRDASGRIVGASKIARDITARKRAEAALRDLNENLERRVAERTQELAAALEREHAQAIERKRAEAALRQAQKIEAVGQLASGMAHDFNNLLTAILGNLELLDRRIGDESLRKLLQAAMRSATRGAKLNEQMLAFSRRQHLVPTSVDLNSVVAGIEEMLLRTLGGTVAVSTEFERNLWPALVDPHQLEVVLLNLAINARDAMPGGGRLLIATRKIKATELDRSLDLAPGDYVCLSVADTGIGMSEAVLARACEPFFTTKDVGKGSGLGLAQVYGLARQSGGALRIRSAPGQGTTVELYLPRSFRHAERPIVPRNDRDARAASKHATVLVVDDQEDVREAAVGQLEALGYRVVQAASGDTALALLGNADAVEVLMVDYAMPGMSGIELARAARAKCPGLPVLIVTGYVDTTRVEGQVHNVRILKKPYRLTELASALDSMLEQRSRTTAATNVVTLRAGED